VYSSVLSIPNIKPEITEIQNDMFLQFFCNMIHLYVLYDVFVGVKDRRHEAISSTRDDSVNSQVFGGWNAQRICRNFCQNNGNALLSVI